LKAEPLCDLLLFPRDASDSRKLEPSPPTRAAPRRAPSASGLVMDLVVPFHTT
ncbi:hypothetical protein K5549_019259, partial [Capra hircus]